VSLMFEPSPAAIDGRAPNDSHQLRVQYLGEANVYFVSGQRVEFEVPSLRSCFCPPTTTVFGMRERTHGRLLHRHSNRAQFGSPLASYAKYMDVTGAICSTQEMLETSNCHSESDDASTRGCTACLEKQTPCMYRWEKKVASHHLSTTPCIHDPFHPSNIEHASPTPC
jgi:hypothetical protein